MPDFKLVADFEPTGDQPQAIERLADGLARGPAPPDPARRDRHRQDLHDRQGDRAAPEADARAGPQQDARRAALRRVPRVLPGQRGRVLRQLLRLLPARGVPAAVRHVHREGLEPERRDRQAPPRGDPRPVRAARRDHRRQRQLHLRPRRAGRLRRDGPPPPARRPVPARRRPPPPGRSAVPAQRPGAPAGPLPGPRRHPRDRARVGRPDRPGRVLRRRGRADHRGRPADRRAARRAQRPQRLPGDPLRDPGRQAQGGARRHRGRDGAPGRRDGGPGPGARGGPPAPADDVRPGDDARARLLLRRRELHPPPRPAGSGLAAVDPARLLPAGLAAGRRREPHVDPAGRRDVQERPDPQGDPGRLRVPPAVGPRQPAAHVRGVRGDRPPGGLPAARRRARTSSRRASGSSSSSSGRPASSTRRSPSARPRARSTTCSRRSAAGSSAASGRSSRP